MVLRYYLRLIGHIFGEDRPYQEPDIDPYDFHSTPIVDAGITWLQFLKRLLIPATARTGYGCPYMCTTEPPECPERGRKLFTKIRL